MAYLSCLQIGNVALNKLVESNTIVDENNQKYNKPHLWHDHDFVVDGSTNKAIFGGSCNVIYTATKQDLAFWMVDLDDIYVIWNITLLSTDNSVDSSYLENFDITVGNTSDRTEHSRCLRQTSRIGRSQTRTLTCDTMQVGRYLAISKYTERNKVGRLPLCEVIVMGQKWVLVDWEWCADDAPDNLWCRSCFGDMSPTCLASPCATGNYGISCSGSCGNCADNVTCDARSGHCANCEIGWKPPLCQEACSPGTFGYHCLNKCGSCKGYCDVTTGVCPHGCQQWYIGDNCDVNIPVVNLTHVNEFHSLFERQTMIILYLPFPQVALDQYHSVHVAFMHEHDPMVHYREHKDITLSYSNASYWLKIKVNNLRPNTQYWFRVYVSRTQNNVTEMGAPTPRIRAVTRADSNSYVPQATTPDDAASTAAVAGTSAPQNGPQSNDRKSQPINVTALVVSLVVIVAVALAVGAALLYIRRRRSLMFTFGRYVQDGFENHFVEQEDKMAESQPQHETNDSGIYAELSK